MMPRGRPQRTATVTARLRTRAALGLAAAAAILAAQAPPPAADASRALPKLIAGSYAGIRPRAVYFSGDAGNIVTGIRWTSWTRTSAAGHGTSIIQGCVPNCAAGSQTPVPTSIALSRPRGGHFTRIVEVRRGHALIARYGSAAGNWPGGAQQ